MLILRNKLYRQWRLLDWISLFGDSFYYIALLTYASSLTNPSLAILIVSVSETVPKFLQMILGVLADGTFHRTKRFFQSGIVRGTIYLIVGFLIMGSSSIYTIIIIGILNAIGDTFGSYVDLCISPFIKYVVREEDLEEALATNATAHNIIYLFSSFIGATLLGFVSIRYLPSKTQIYRN